MPDWLLYIIDLWPILSSITPVILLAGFYWLRTKFPTKEDFDALAGKVAQLSVDQVKCSDAVEQLKLEQDDPPTRLELLEHMAKLSGRLHAVEATTAGIAKQVDTSNDYLQILIERGVR